MDDSNEIKKGWTYIPNWVLMHPDLGRVDIAVYLALAYHADNETRECWPGHKLLMAEARVGGERHLRTSLRRLEEVGAVVITKRPGYPDLYRLTRRPPRDDSDSTRDDKRS